MLSMNSMKLMLFQQPLTINEPPVLVQKRNTRNHDNVKILAEDSVYQRKKHVEVPSTFRGNSSTVGSNDSIFKQAEQVDLSQYTMSFLEHMLTIFPIHHCTFFQIRHIHVF